MRLYALFAMALVAANAVDIHEEETLAELPLDDEVMVEEQTKEEEEAALSALNDAMYAGLGAHEDQMVEVDEEEQGKGWRNGKWNLWIKSAHYDKLNVINKVLSMYAQGKRFFPATNQLFTDPARGKVKTLKIVYRWNKKWYTKYATEHKKNSFVNLPEASVNKPKPKVVLAKPTLQKIVSAAQNDCGYWCKKQGGPLATVRRRPNSHYHKGRSCTHSATAKAGNWLTVGIKDVKEITNIRVLNRKDCCQDRLWHASVFAGWKLCGTYNNRK
jgi:hypothetical protein